MSSILPLSNNGQSTTENLQLPEQNVERASKISAVGNIQPTQAVTALATMPVQDIQKITEHLNQLMQNLNIGINFELCGDSGQVVIRVTDNQTHEVIRQMPTEESIRLRKIVDNLQGVILSTQA